jgi:membrane protease YdiL (CAAX protease family)
MPMLKLLPLLVLSLAVMAWFVRNDSAEYAAFKQLTGTADRQRCYAGWIVKSFGLFSGTTLFCLLILQRLHAFTQMPAEFLPLTARLRAIVPPSQIQPVTIGDSEPLMPRNTAETGWTTLLALNAGLSEEVFFRLLLPLLLAGLLHNALFAFALATVLFGLIHFYQGTAGIVLTALLGAGLACVYLWTGNVWIAIAVHAGIDLLGLVVRPTATRMLSRAPAQITEHDKLS